MQNRAAAALALRLGPSLSLSKSRLETLCLIVVGMIGARTVNLGHIATERGGQVRVGSTYRRLQRFFQYVALGADWAAPLLAGMLGTDRWTLVLDRTQWAIGRTEVNFLVLAAVTRRKRVPLLWTLLPHRGSSSTADRIALVERYLALFPPTSIRVLLGDREFVGNDWFNYLCRKDIPFAIRLRANLRMTDADGHDLSFEARLRRAGRGRTFSGRLGPGHAEGGGADAPLLGFAAKRLDGEWLIVASNLAPAKGLALYRKRWQIECLFAEAKTRGLNLEDTRLSCPRKLALLMGLVALALAWAACAAIRRLGHDAPARKVHGFYEKSIFRIGFDELRNLLRSPDADPNDPCRAFKRLRVV
jgi:hypothetical protein